MNDFFTYKHTHTKMIASQLQEERKLTHPNIIISAAKLMSNTRIELTQAASGESEQGCQIDEHKLYM